MMLRWAKILLVSAVAFYYSLLVFNNTTDYESNHQFVRHVLMMDSTFPGNRGMWRAINSPAVHTLFYLSIILWEGVTAMLCWWGAIRLVRVRKQSAQAFNRAKSVAIGGLTLGLLMWLVAFLSIGGEGFLMWQSRAWNGQEAALRMFIVIGITLILAAQPDAEIEVRT
jgi:predicted small integral membrane protein